MGIGWPADKWGSTAPFPHAPNGGRGARRLKIDPERFWTQPERWPPDLAGYVFLGRGVLQVARVQVSPPEPMNLPFSPRAQRSYDVAIERIAQEAAAGRLKTATLDETGLTPMRTATWAMMDRKVIFGCFFRFPGRVYRSGIYSESKLPIYVERKSLTDLVNWTRTMAEAAAAAADFERVGRDRFTYEHPPDVLPPSGFLSLDSAVARLQMTGEKSASVAKTELRELAAAGKVQAIAQLWESGALLELPAEIWPSHDAATMLEEGIVSIPEFYGASPAFSHWAFIRFRFASAQQNNAPPSTSSEGSPHIVEDGRLDPDVPRKPAKRRGAPNLAPKDRPFIEMMRQLVEQEDYSRLKASEIIMAEHGGKVAGTGAPESKARRLREGYNRDRLDRGLGEIGD